MNRRRFLQSAMIAATTVTLPMKVFAKKNSLLTFPLSNPDVKEILKAAQMSVYVKSGDVGSEKIVYVFGELSCPMTKAAFFKLKGSDSGIEFRWIFIGENAMRVYKSRDIETAAEILKNPRAARRLTDAKSQRALALTSNNHNLAMRHNIKLNNSDSSFGFPTFVLETNEGLGIFSGYSEKQQTLGRTLKITDLKRIVARTNHPEISNQILYGEFQPIGKKEIVNYTNDIQYIYSAMSLDSVKLSSFPAKSGSVGKYGRAYMNKEGIWIEKRIYQDTGPGFLFQPHPPKAPQIDAEFIGYRKRINRSGKTQSVYQYMAKSSTAFTSLDPNGGFPGEGKAYRTKEGVWIEARIHKDSDQTSYLFQPG